MVSTADQLAIEPADLVVQRLGEPTIPSPLVGLAAGPGRARRTTSTSRTGCCSTTPLEMAARAACGVGDLPSFEPGGPREQHLLRPGHDPGRHRDLRRPVPRAQQRDPRAGPPALRALRRHRDLRLPQRLRGLAERRRADACSRRDVVADIHNRGGTILGTSRGDQDPDAMVDDAGAAGHLGAVRHRRRRHAARRAEDRRRGGPRGRSRSSVVGVPKTIDNDIPYIDQSFGFQTAFARATESIRAAHTEASSTPNGVGLVKLMGRHSGFIACYAALANHDVDFVLIPEVPFAARRRDGFLRALRAPGATARARRRRGGRGRGAGPAATTTARVDASGNARLADIGGCCATRIIADFAAAGDRAQPALRRPGLRDPQRARQRRTTRCTACGSRRPPCTPRWPAGPRWWSAAGTAGSCTCRSPWPPAAATRSTRTATCGCRCSRPPASRPLPLTQAGSSVARESVRVSAPTAGDEADDDREHGVGDPLAVEERRDEVAAPGAGGQLGGDQRGDQRADDGGADAGADLLGGVVERGADRGAVARHRVDEGDRADRHDGAQADRSSRPCRRRWRAYPWSTPHARPASEPARKTAPTRQAMRWPNRSREPLGERGRGEHRDDDRQVRQAGPHRAPAVGVLEVQDQAEHHAGHGDRRPDLGDGGAADGAVGEEAEVEHGRGAAALVPDERDAGERRRRRSRRA